MSVQRGYSQRWCNARLRAGASSSLCLSCARLPSSNYVTTMRDGGEAAWVQTTPGITHAGPATVPPREAPDGATLGITFRVSPTSDPFWRHSAFVWWGALPRDLREAALGAAGPAAAYGATEDYTSGSKWPNSGTCEVRDGVVYVRCMTPQSYREEGRRWARHLHFMRVVDGEIDASDVRTLPVWPTHFHGDTYRCVHLGEATSHHGCCIVTREHVASVLADIATPLFKKNYWFVDATASKKDIFGAGADRFRDLHHEAGDEELRAVGGEIGDDPVVIYCAHSECSAATHLIERLGRLNLCPNFFYMPEGYQ